MDIQEYDIFGVWKYLRIDDLYFAVRQTDDCGSRRISAGMDGEACPLGKCFTVTGKYFAIVLS